MARLDTGAAALSHSGEPDLYVMLDMKLVNFSYLDFKLLVKTSTPLLLIRRQLVERHGRMSELHLYKTSVTADNEMRDDSCTLAEYGIVGKRKSEAPDTVVLFYNFVPYDASNALLLATHTRERVGVS